MERTEEEAYLLVALKKDDAAALVARREVIAGVIELDGRDDVGCEPASTFTTTGMVSRRP